MHRVVWVIAIMACVVAFGATQAAAVSVPIVVYSYEWLRDADGDGIPNHLDGDWVPPLDGTGYQMKHGILSPTTCSPFDINTGQTFQYWYRYRDGHKSPGLESDQDRIRLRDGTRDRDRLHLKDGSCK